MRTDSPRRAVRPARVRPERVEKARPVQRAQTPPELLAQQEARVAQVRQVRQVAQPRARRVEPTVQQMEPRVELKVQQVELPAQRAEHRVLQAPLEQPVRLEPQVQQDKQKGQQAGLKLARLVASLVRPAQAMPRPQRKQQHKVKFHKHRRSRTQARLVLHRLAALAFPQLQECRARQEPPRFPVRQLLPTCRQLPTRRVPQRVQFPSLPRCLERRQLQDLRYRAEPRVRQPSPTSPEPLFPPRQVFPVRPPLLRPPRFPIPPPARRARRQLPTLRPFPVQLQEALRRLFQAPLELRTSFRSRLSTRLPCLVGQSPGPRFLAELQLLSSLGQLAAPIHKRLQQAPLRELSPVRHPPTSCRFPMRVRRARPRRPAAPRTHPRLQATRCRSPIPTRRLLPIPRAIQGRPRT